MMTILMLLAGILLVLGTVAAYAFSISRTPLSLRGFYGFFYFLISIAGLIGGVALIAQALFA